MYIYTCIHIHLSRQPLPRLPPCKKYVYTCIGIHIYMYIFIPLHECIRVYTNIYIYIGNLSASTTARHVGSRPPSGASSRPPSGASSRPLSHLSSRPPSGKLPQSRASSTGTHTHTHTHTSDHAAHALAPPLPPYTHTPGFQRASSEEQGTGVFAHAPSAVAGVGGPAFRRPLKRPASASRVSQSSAQIGIQLLFSLSL